MVFERGLSTVCGDPLVAFEDVWSERRVIMSFFSEAVFNEHRYSQDGQTRRLVLHCLLSTVCDDLLVAFEQAWAGVMVFASVFSRVVLSCFTAKLFLTFIGTHKTDRSSNGF